MIRGEYIRVGCCRPSLVCPLRARCVRPDSLPANRSTAAFLRPTDMKRLPGSKGSCLHKPMAWHSEQLFS